MSADSLPSFLVGGAAAALLSVLMPHPARKQPIPQPTPPTPPLNIGILASACYFPSTHITQSALETHNNIPAGKYTLGLGQESMSITGDVEDVNSIALTAVSMLLDQYNIDPMTVGRLEVGTETLIDKSKSTKTVLMSLFPGNSNIEGVTTVNACYGGTAALLNAFLWCESSGWDGRFAIVVACDIANYAPGPARPTSGVGAVAFLVGRDAPLSFTPKLRATHAANTWDFYKPDHRVEHPVVDGALSQTCYYQALEGCYTLYCDKQDVVSSGANPGDSVLTPFTACTPKFFVFHAPYNKLVQKSYARLYFIDARRRFAKTGTVDPRDKRLAAWIDVPIESTYTDRGLDAVLKDLSKAKYEEQLKASNYASRLIGNTYAASVFVGLCSLIDADVLSPGDNVTVFSYGSGSMATMYNLTVTPTNSPFTLARQSANLNLRERLASRELVAPDELDYALNCRARCHGSVAPYSPCYPTERLFKGTYYLAGIDEKWRRTYARVVDTHPGGGRLVPPICLRHETNEQHGVPVQGRLSALARKDSSIDVKISSVITGVAVGLPGDGKPPC